MSNGIRKFQRSKVAVGFFVCVFALAMALQTIPFGANAAGKSLTFDASISPSVSSPSATQSYTVLFTNTASGNGNTDIEAVKVYLPSGFTKASIPAPTATTAGYTLCSSSPANSIWINTGTSVPIGGTVSVTFTATAPASSGPYIFTAEAYGNQSCAPGGGNPFNPGNTSLTVQNPAVNNPPVINLNGPSTVNLTVGDTYNETATATDVEDGNLTSSMVITGGPVDTSSVGTFTLTYNVTDSGSLAATTVTRTVNVNAAPINNPPVISLNSASTITLIVGDTYTETATANDVEDGNLTSSMVITGGPVVTTSPATFTLTYNVIDSGNLAATPVTRTVIVNAAAVNNPPVINLNGPSTVNLTVGDTYNETATATDVEDGNLTSSMVITGGPVDTSSVGTFTLTYNVTDSGSLAATTVTRTVNVNAAPTPTSTPSSGGGGGGGNPNGTNGGGGSVVGTQFLGGTVAGAATVATPAPVVAGAATELPKTGFGMLDQMLVALFSAMLLTGMFMTLLGSNKLPAAILKRIN